MRLTLLTVLPFCLGAGLNPAPAPLDDTGGIPDGYPTLVQIHDELDRIEDFPESRAIHRDLTDQLGVDDTWEGRSLRGLWLFDERSEDLPVQLVVAGLHPREAVPPLAALALAERLASASDADPSALAVVEGWQTVIVPMANPDGWAYVLEEDNLWRKNRRVYDDGVGVDLNRNWPFGWDSDCAGSTDPEDRKYKGPEPSSEAEVLALMTLMERLRPARVVDIHGFGSNVKVGYCCHEHPLDSHLDDLAVRLADDLGFEGAIEPPSADGELIGWALNRYAALAMIPEIGESFQPEIEDARLVADQVADGLLTELARLPPVSGHVVEAGTGEPVEASITVQGLAFEHGESSSSSGLGGRFDLWLPPGSWLLVFEAEGYAPGASMALVLDGTPSSLEVELEPLEPGTEGTSEGCA